MVLYTVSATDTRNAAFYVKFVLATTRRAATAHVKAKGYRVDAIEETCALVAMDALDRQVVEVAS